MTSRKPKERERERERGGGGAWSMVCMCCYLICDQCFQTGSRGAGGGYSTECVRIEFTVAIETAAVLAFRNSRSCWTHSVHHCLLFCFLSYSTATHCYLLVSWNVYYSGLPPSPYRGNK